MAEIGRRLVHASGVVIPAVYVVGLVSWNQLRILLVIGLVIAAGLETMRLFVGLDWWIYETLTRPYEANTVAGYGLYMASITIVALLFDPEVAIPAMLMLMLGDPISGYLGSGELRRFKRPRAVAGMFVVSFVFATPFAYDVLNDPLWAAVAALAGATAGTVADSVTFRIRGEIVDDNLTIPIVAALVLWLAYLLLPV